MPSFAKAALHTHKIRLTLFTRGSDKRRAGEAMKENTELKQKK